MAWRNGDSSRYYLQSPKTLMGAVKDKQQRAIEVRMRQYKKALEMNSFRGVIVGIDKVYLFLCAVLVWYNGMLVLAIILGTLDLSYDRLPLCLAVQLAMFIILYYPLRKLFHWCSRLRYNALLNRIGVGIWADVFSIKIVTEVFSFSRKVIVSPEFAFLYAHILEQTKLSEEAQCFYSYAVEKKPSLKEYVDLDRLPPQCIEELALR